MCGYWLWHVLRLESLLHDMIEGRMRGKATRGSKRMHLLSDLMKGKYVALKRTAEEEERYQMNNVFGKEGRLASEEVTLQLALDSSKCIPVLIYELECFSLRATKGRR